MVFNKHYLLEDLVKVVKVRHNKKVDLVVEVHEVVDDFVREPIDSLQTVIVFANRIVHIKEVVVKNKSM